MKPHRAKKHKSGRRRQRPASRFRKWHRTTGVIALAFIIWLTVSGLLLTNSQLLGLDEKTVHNPQVASLYGIQQAKIANSYASERFQVAQLDGGEVWIDHYLLPGQYKTLLGAVSLAELEAIALTDKLLVMDVDGGLVDELPLPGQRPFERAGRDAKGRLVLDDGIQHWVADAELAEVLPVADLLTVNWQEPVVPDPALVEQIQLAWSGQGLTLERVLLDLHSGQVLGSVGRWVVNIAGLALLFLNVSGLVLWLRRRRRQSQKPSN